MDLNYIKKRVVDYIILPLWHILDYFVIKPKSFWGFTVHPININHFSESPRAVFEQIKKDSSIKKIIFIRNENSDLQINEAINTELVRIDTIRGMWLLARCKVLIVFNAVSLDYTLRFGNKWFSINKMNMKRRTVVNVWHGIPLKKVFSMWNPELKKRYDKISYREYERSNYAGLVASSKMDSYAMASTFHPIQHSRLWVTGLARNDFLINTIEELPEYLKIQVMKIKQIKSDRTLITYAPTHRQTTAIEGSSYYVFNQEEINQLKKVLKKHNAILGIRMHYLKKSDSVLMIEKLVDNEFIFDLGNVAFPEIGPVIRESDLIITDYSSLFLDAMYAAKPVICFAYDLEHYRDNQDGLMYDLDMVFPGPITQNFEILKSEIKSELLMHHQVKSERYQFIKKLFFDFSDGKNSERIVSKIKNTLSNNM
jgi:CDP-glycerol glycerophosphotransferase (TagB/SpsB family)